MTMNKITTGNIDTIDQGITSLTAAQGQAIDSNYYVWVTASAGSGKTKVLIDRVLHLLLVGHRLRDLLVITFTRAAAAEIKNRLDKKLAEWTFTPDDKLLAEIKNILGNKWQAAQKDEKMNIARGLFLRMMDEKQNLTINTIHGFCQQLLNYFPLEAGVPFGFRLAEENEANQLLHHAIDTTLLRGDSDVAPLLEEAKRYWQGASDLRDKIKKLLQDPRALRKQQELKNDQLDIWQKNHGWLSVAAMTDLDTIIKYLCGGKDEIYFLTANKTARKSKSLSDGDKAIAEQLVAVYGQINKATTAGSSYVVLALAIKILDHYEKIKFENGLLDYDDLIIKAGDLLADEKNIHPWVQYKMAGSVKHLLLDEAQDTSPSQWRVVESLVAGFSTLQKNRGDHGFLVVGDMKQSIFGFQGADVAVYQQYKEKWQKTFADDFRALPFDISFRSGKNILQFIDKVFGDKGFADKDFGGSHKAHYTDLPSQIILKDFFSYEKEENEKQDLSDYIASVAQDIKQQIDDGVITERGAARRVVAGDVMVLIRKRNPLQAPLVAALKKIGVAVAGRDRIILRDEWLVKDLLNLGQFALLPRVDFYLANLLVSPFCGLSYKELEEIALARDGTLYDSLLAYAKKNSNGWWQALVAWVDKIAGAAMQKNAFEFFYDILQSPCPVRHGDKSFASSARAMLLARWGREEQESITIFLDRLLSLEKNKVNHLAAVVDNLLADDSEIKKETSSDQSAGVRIITCHGAKGLESPIVFLPDDIRKRGKGDMALVQDGATPPLFLSARQKNNHDGWNHKKLLSEEEEDRLLYVALTRAKNLLVISGFGKKPEEKKKAGEDTAYEKSWYYRCHRAMTDLPAAEVKKINGAMVYGNGVAMKDITDKKTTSVVATAKEGSHDSWMTKKINLSYIKPSAPYEANRDNDFSTSPQAQKGSAVHRLLQVLPRIEKNQWSMEAKKILTKEFPSIIDKELQLISEVEAVLDNGRNLPESWQDIFLLPATGELFLEQEVMGMVAGVATRGRIDRMLVTADEVKILDYKTSAKTIVAVPEDYKKQMAGYRALLATAYPNKKIRTALLFTNDLQFIEIE